MGVEKIEFCAVFSLTKTMQFIDRCKNILGRQSELGFDVSTTNTTLNNRSEKHLNADMRAHVFQRAQHNSKATIKIRES